MVLIAGIDIGTTTAIVLLDENKRIIDNISKKNFSEKEIVSYISSKKYVVLLATDKAKIPSRIKKISARLNLGVFAPKKDIPLEYKKKFYTDKKLRRVLENIHEFDAYIAAYYTIDQIRDIITKTKRITEDIEKQTAILKKYFKDLKKEPISIYRELFANNEDTNTARVDNKSINNSRQYKKQVDNENKQSKSIKIVVKRIIEEDKKIKNRVTELTKLLSKYISALDIISESILRGKTAELVPKISYTEKKKISTRGVFVDNEEYINRIYKYKEVYIPKEKFRQIKDKIHVKKIYLVEEYLDMQTLELSGSFD